MGDALYQFRKILLALLSPFALSILLIFWGVFRRRFKPVVAGTLLLLIAAIPLLSDMMVLQLERQYPHLDAVDCPQADVIVALGGYGSVSERFPHQIEWSDAVDRFEGAIRLYQLKKAPVLLFTDNIVDAGTPKTIGELVRQAAIDHGVPSGAVRISRVARVTAEEAVIVKEFLQETGGKRVILVTSAMHMARAAVLFRKAGIEFVPFPVDYQSSGWVVRWDTLMPSPGGLEQFGKFEHEMLGLTVARLQLLLGR